MAVSRYYSSTAALATLSSGVSAGGTSFIVSSTSGFPAQTPYTLLIDEGTVSEEIVTVTAVSGTTLTVIRGEDGTVGVAHDPGARVRHAMTARDLRESRQHEDASAAHGRSSALVGINDTQTLDNKTFQSGTGATTPLTVQEAGSQTAPLVLVKKSDASDIARISRDGILVGGTLGNTSVALFPQAAAQLYGEVVEVKPPNTTTAGVRVNMPASGSTNRALSVEEDTVEKAYITAAGRVEGTSLTQAGTPVVTTTDVQTLSNKTLTSPTINSPTVVTPTLSGAITTQSLSSYPLIVCTSTTRPASPVEGMTIYETDTDYLLTYDGTAWRWAGGKVPFTHIRFTADTTLPGGENVVRFDRVVEGSGWSTSTFRFTPTVAGIYAVSFVLVGASSTIDLSIKIRKNDLVQSEVTHPTTSSTYAKAIELTKFIRMNGSTDYIDLVAARNGTGGYAIEGGDPSATTGPGVSEAQFTYLGP